MLNLHGSAIIVQHGSRRSTRACAHPVTFSKRHGRPATCQAAQVESVSSREDVARHMIGIEKSLPGMSLSQLANAFSSCVHTYRAASLSQLAMSCSDELFVGVVDYFTNELPDQSWLLTFRAAVAKHLSNHPAVLSDTLAAVRAAPVSTAAQHGASAASHTYYSPCQLQHEHLAQILRGLAALPIMVVQPLPIGFGTLLVIFHLVLITHRAPLMATAPAPVPHLCDCTIHLHSKCMSLSMPSGLRSIQGHLLCA